MKKTKLRIAKAEKVATLSSHPKRMGAAIYKQQKLISIGWNTLKTHTKSRTWNNTQHAEFAALLGVPKHHVVGAEMYVVRILKNGNRAHSKPCGECEELLWAAGIKRVWYISENGVVRRMKPSRRK